jgi:hypothetical protein
VKIGYALLSLDHFVLLIIAQDSTVKKANPTVFQGEMVNANEENAHYDGPHDTVYSWELLRWRRLGDERARCQTG